LTNLGVGGLGKNGVPKGGFKPHFGGGFLGQYQFGVYGYY